MTGKNKTRLVGWHPSDPELVRRLDAEIDRRGGGRGAQSAILDEALARYLDEARATANLPQGKPNRESGSDTGRHCIRSSHCDRTCPD